MKITGTKKLLILLLTLFCAFAAGLGALFGTAFSSDVSARAEVESAVPEEEKEVEEVTSESEGKSEGQTAENDTADLGEEKNEENYDETYDEGIISAIAELTGFEDDFVNFYLHFKGFDAADFYKQLSEQIAEHEKMHAEGEERIAILGADEEIPEPEEEEQSSLLSEMTSFRDSYAEGLVNADEYEEEDWFVPPDEVSTFASYIAYTAKSHLAIVSGTGISATGWTTFGSGYSNSTSRGVLGARATVSAPINTKITLQIAYHNTIYNFIEREANEHWSKDSLYYTSDHNSNGQQLTNKYIIDGDAPTGTVFKVVKYYCNGCSCSAKSYYYSLTANKAAGSCKYFVYEVTVKRTTNPTKMTIKNDGGTLSTTSKANDTLTKTYTGSPARITFTPDLGMGLVSWSASPAGYVTIFSRAVHAESTGTLILECSTAGKYTITLTSFSNAWADGTTGVLTYYFEVLSQTTTKPKMVREDGVSATGTSKTVNDTGAKQTVSFYDCDSQYVTASSNGLYVDSWTTAKRLTMYQTQQGTYTITLSLTNSGGCKWDDGTIEPIIYTFKIAEMMIDVPTIVGVSGNTLTVNYNKSQQAMTLSPALEGQMMIIVNGLTYSYNKSAKTVTFNGTDAQRYEVRLSPSTGFIWADGTSQSISYYFIINPLEMATPVMNEPPAEGVTIEGNKKTVVFDPTPGSFHTLTIDNYDPDGLQFSSALIQHSWTADSSGKGTGTLVLKASNSQTYDVIISCKDNYVWNSSVQTRSISFTLEIERYVLGIPEIIRNTNKDDPLFDNNNIEGDTKTVAYEAVRDNNALGYMKLFVGGTNSSQVSITITPAVNPVNTLNQSWLADDRAIRFTGTQADNYLIVVTPTSNYQWAKGDHMLRNFKFVITPILRDDIKMEIYNDSSNANQWEVRETRTGNLTYTGDFKYMMIGSSTNDNYAFKATDMNFEIVDTGARDTLQRAMSPTSDGIIKKIENGCIYFYAKQAGTYKVSVTLKNSNYNWRSGGVDLTFTLIIDPQEINAPTLAKGECGGYRKFIDPDDPMARMMSCRYDSNPVNMVIQIDTLTMMNLNDIVNIEFEAEGDKPIGNNDWANSSEYSRIVVTATEAGYYTCMITIKDPNFSWKEHVPDYTFELMIERAPLDGVTFYYEDVTEDNKIGQNNSMDSKEYIIDTDQYVIVKRNFVTDEAYPDEPKKYDAIFYDQMFTYSITDFGTGASLETGVYTGNTNIRLALRDAGDYGLYITPTDNFCWSDGYYYPFQCSFTITPKAVALPVLDTSDQSDTVFYSDTTRESEYCAEAQRLTISLGEDFKAFKVDSLPYGMTVDTTNHNEKAFVFLATNRGRYQVVVTLSSGNYAWADTPNSDAGQTFYMNIERGGIDIPTAWLEETQNIHAAENQEGIQLLHQNINVEWVEFKNAQYYVYLLGDIINSREAIITVETETNNYTSENLKSGYVSGTDGVVNGYEVTMRTANVYKITVEFATFKDAFGNDDYNYYWKDVSGSGSDGQDNTAKVFTLEIKKKAVELPKLADNLSAVMEDNGFSTYRTFNYGHHDMTITGYLPGFMSYSIDNSRLKVDPAKTDVDNGILTLTTNVGEGGSRYASVANTYRLTMSIDAANEKWDITFDDPDQEDSSPKYYNLVIEKLAIGAPVIEHNDAESANLGYGTDGLSKWVIYTGGRWDNAFIISDIKSTYMNYALASSSTMQGSYLENDTDNGPVGRLTVSTAADSASYDVIFGLKDTANMRWDFPDGDSADLIYSFIVKPKIFDKTQIFNAGETDAVYDPESKTVTYNYNYQYFTLENLVLDSENKYMTLEVISGMFSDAQTSPMDGKTDYFQITYSARSAGKYTVRVRLTQNASWGDGEPRYIDFVFNIDKLQFETPYIVEDANDDFEEIKDFTKTTSYELDANFAEVLKTMYINEYNPDIMGVSNVSVTVNEGESAYDKYNYDVSLGYYFLSAYKAGTYTITFRMRDFANMRWKFADKESVTFTLRVNKLELENPQLEQSYLIDGENAATPVFTATYDGRLHNALLNNVLVRKNNADSSEPYMFYTYSTNTDTTDVIGVEYLRTTAKDGAYLTVNDIFGDSHTGQFKDTAVKPEDEVKLENILKFNARMPGAYTVTVSLTNTNNMCWKGTAATVQTYTLRISKYEHATPAVESGKSTVLQYTGAEQNFYIVNAFNGDDAKGFEYETMALGNAVTTGQDPVWKMVSWKDGRIVLAAKEVGTYSLTIRIKDTNTTSWRNTTATSLVFTFTISKRSVGANISYSSDEPALDASLKGGATSWAISQSVKATLSVTGIRERKPEDTVDNNIILEMYCYHDSTPGTILNRVAIGTNSWNMQKQANGTYNLTYVYEIPFGEQNVRRGNYTIVVSQPQPIGNYTFNTKTFKFTIAADPAPFDTNMLVWQYTLGDDKDTLVTVADWSNHTTSATALPLDYLEDGRMYNFNLYMNDTGMAGFDKNGYTDLNSALLSWEVKFSSYSGTRSAHYAGVYWVRAKIVAKDPALYSFNDYTTTFYYRIKQVKYDLSGLVWDYDSDNPFVFDGTAKSVKLKGTLPTGLTVQNYLVSGYDLNTQIYAGNYHTTVKFVSTNKNYQTIDLTNPNTYINDGTFVPVCDWQIKKADLPVEWMTVQDSTGDGSALVYVPILKKHAEKVNYIYEKFDGTSWKNIGNDFSHTGEEKFRVTAELKKSPYAQTSAAYNGDLDYARNYELRFVMEPDPTVHTKEFTLGGNSSTIGVYAVVGGTKLNDEAPYSKYPYTGKPYAAQIVVFYDPTGLITDSNINVTYYSSINYNKPLSGAPTVPGKYRIKLALKNVNFGGETEYVLGTSQFDFEIEKGTFDPADIIWTYTHTDLSNQVHNAHFDTDQKKWVDDVTGEEVTFVYDGAAHIVTLKSKNADLKITNKNHSNINAGKYKSSATYSFDATKWNAPSIVTDFDWIIEKAVIDISQVQWDYEDGFMFTLSGGVAKKYSVALKNVPELLKEYVVYNTVNSKGDKVANLASLAGTYTTTVTIKDLPENSNYVAGEWPSTVSTSCNWEIDQREINIPASTDVWTVFDGEQHNLLTAVSFDADWQEYYTIAVKYTDGVAAATAYDGTKDYGYKFTAYNAGKYTFTLAFKSNVNSGNTNVVWTDGSSTFTGNQTVDLDISKAALTVTGWNENKESSTVIMTCDSLPAGTVLEKFISYKFYAGIGVDGTEVTLDTVLNTDTAEDFTIAPYVKEKFGNNITLAFPTGVSEYYAFTTTDISGIPDSDQIQVAEKPVIKAYIMNGVTYNFDEEVLKEDHVYIIYSGAPVTFVIDQWDTYYVNFLDVWGGDDLTQNEAGTYSITLILKKSDTNPLYWSKTGDDDTGYTYDRSSVTLKFEIRYLMLDVPSFDANAEYKLKELTYTGKDLDIITESLTEEQIDKLIKTQYGDYVEISGNVGKEAGSYSLNLRIKDEYANTVRWKNGTEFGQQGTYTIVWKINPIYLIVPKLSTSTVITYDGNEHSVFEALEGYNADAMSPELLGVLQNARLSNEGSRAINAGSYTATFTLPDSNYAWKDVAGNVLNINEVKIENWKINPKVLDMSGVYWSYNEKSPFVFTLDNGIPHEHTLELLGIPEELKQFISYSTNGVAGNKASAVGRYNTVVRLFNPEGDDAKNYALVSMPPSFSGSYPSNYGDLEINWQIVRRTFAVPADKELEFDNTVQDLLKVFGFAEGWESYMDVSVEYSTDGTTFAEYKVDNDEQVGYSIYNAFRLGYYRLRLALKADLNKDVESVVWLSGNTALTTDQLVTLNYKQLVVEVTGWKEDVEDSRVISTKIDEIKDTPAMDMFEYVITDIEDGKVYTAEQVSERGTGYAYDILFRIKPEHTYAISTGVKLTFNKDVDNPYRFGNYNFGSQTVVWVPLPEFELDEQDFTGGDVKFKIKNWEQYYAISDAFRTSFNGNTKYAAEGFHIADDLLSFVYAMDGSLDTSTGTISVTDVGEYKVRIRFASGINLSWYDSSKYTVVNGALTDKATNKALAKADWEKLISRYSQTLSYTVNVKIVDRIDLSAFLVNIPQITYDGTLKNVTDLYRTFFDQILAEYGQLIEISGEKGTAVGEYSLSISLKDTVGSCWNMNETETVTVKADGYKLSYFNVGGQWKVLYVAVDENGDFITDSEGNYVEYNKGAYEVAAKYKYSYKVRYYQIGEGAGKAQLDENGKPLPMVIGQDGEGNDIFAQFVVNEDGTAVRYTTPVGGISADGKGNFVAVYELDAEGNKVLNELPDTENGHPVLDEANSSVTVKRIKTSTDPLTFKWRIVSQGLTAPYINTDKLLVYTSQEINVESYGAAIIGYNPAIMRIEGGTATNAGEYTAKVYLTDANYCWASIDGVAPEYVELKWVIAKATIDLSGISWSYTDETVYTYELVNGKAKAYKVELIFPDELKAYKNLVEYTTNGTVGANAGRKAGKYVTSFAFNIDMNNFEDIKLPEGIAESVTWYINKLVLQVPQLTATQIVFDDTVRSVTSLLTLPENWNEYYDIEILQIINNVLPMPYSGYDQNGDGTIDDTEKFLIYGVGTYRFNLTIKAGINTDATKPNVVWFKSAAPVTPDVPDQGETGGGTESGGELVAPVAPASYMFMILPTEQHIEENPAHEVKPEQPEAEEITSAQPEEAEEVAAEEVAAEPELPAVSERIEEKSAIQAVTRAEAPVAAKAAVSVRVEIPVLEAVPAKRKYLEYALPNVTCERKRNFYLFPNRR